MHHLQPYAEAEAPQCRCFVKSRDDNEHGADGIAETYDDGKGDDDDDIGCQFVIVRVAGVARI